MSRVSLDDLRDTKLHEFIEDLGNGNLKFFRDSIAANALFDFDERLDDLFNEHGDFKHRCLEDDDCIVLANFFDNLICRCFPKDIEHILLYVIGNFIRREIIKDTSDCDKIVNDINPDSKNKIILWTSFQAASFVYGLRK